MYSILYANVYYELNFEILTSFLEEILLNL